jgi:predicted GNAT superfamily acetyltransferase
VIAIKRSVNPMERAEKTGHLEYTVRSCSTIEDFKACIRMQREIWQFAELDTTPLRAFLIARHNGGITLGAFEKDGKLIGFSHAVPAFDAHNRPYYYSQMTGVDIQRQNSGVGLQLKLAQRDFALKRGIPLIVWTFDPFQSRNAYLNIVKLGGVIRKYYVNHYGRLNVSALDRGLDTDRLSLEWWIRSERVTLALAGQLGRDSPVATVSIPAETDKVEGRGTAEARRWQLEVRAAFLSRLAEGLYCTDFERGREDAPSRYLFIKDDRREVESSYGQLFGI